MGNREWTQHHKKRIRCLCGKMQAPQDRALNVISPVKESATASSTKNLFGGPQRVCSLLCVDVQQLTDGHSDVGEAETVQQVGGSNNAMLREPTAFKAG